MALTRIRGNQQVQDLSITNSQIALPDGANPDGILLTKIQDGNLLVKSDGSVAFTNTVAGVAPTLPQHIATKAYVDSHSQGLDTKESVRAISTTNITMSGTQTIDGVSLNVGDRVLVAGQTNLVENGIYVVGEGSWLRAPDATTAETVTPGLFTFIEEGTTYANSGWVLASEGPTTLGSTELPFVQFSSAGIILAGNGLSKTGSTLAVVSGNGGITVDGSGVSIHLDGTTLSVSAGGLKLADLPEGQVLIGSAGGIATAQTITGDVTINASGAATIAAGAVSGGKIADGTLALAKLVNGTSGQIIVSAANGTASYVTMSGDATITSAGNLQLAANSVGQTELTTNAVSTTKIVDDAVTSDKLATNSVTGDALADNAVDTGAIANQAVTLGKLVNIPAGQIIMGTAAGNAVVTLSGDVTINESGVVSVNPATVVRVADVIKNEVPSGALNGVNTTYVLANTPKPGTMDVFVNGIHQDPGAGNDYTITDDTITMLYALSAADKIRVNYYK